jgi:hypothetical protein
VYRKGIDLVVNVIPVIAAKYPNVYFIIGGDGPKKLLLEEMRERHQLHDRVQLLGAVPHKHVRDVLTRGHIFLNCSLTESFCIAILEAACCGCFVVSTRVGGVPEVLPSRMIRFAEPSPDHLIDALQQAIPIAKTIDPLEFHAELREIYNWPEVAARTVRVYDAIAATPTVPLIERFRRYYGVGRVFGPIVLVLMSLIYLVFVTLEIVAPAVDVDIVPDLPWSSIEELEDGDTIAEKYDALARSPPPAPSPAVASGSGSASAGSAATKAQAASAAEKKSGTPSQDKSGSSDSDGATADTGSGDGRGERTAGAAASSKGHVGFATPPHGSEYRRTPGIVGDLRIRAALVDSFGTVKATPMASNGEVDLSAFDRDSRASNGYDGGMSVRSVYSMENLHAYGDEGGETPASPPGKGRRARGGGSVSAASGASGKEQAHDSSVQPVARSIKLTTPRKGEM